MALCSVTSFLFTCSTFCRWRHISPALSGNNNSRPSPVHCAYTCRCSFGHFLQCGVAWHGELISPAVVLARPLSGLAGIRSRPDGMLPASVIDSELARREISDAFSGRPLMFGPVTQAQLKSQQLFGQLVRIYLSLKQHSVC